MQHTPIVYSTNISNEIRLCFKSWQKAIQENNKIKKNAAYIIFCNLCEKENKISSKVIEELSKF